MKEKDTMKKRYRCALVVLFLACSFIAALLINGGALRHNEIETHAHGIRLIGDSMSLGTGASQPEFRYPNLLGQLLDMPIHVDAVGGAGSTQIAALVGAYPVMVRIPSGQLTWGKVRVEPMPRVLDGSGNRLKTRVFVDGVPGYLLHDNHRRGGKLDPSLPYYFKADRFSFGMPSEKTTQLKVDESRSKWPTIIWVGRNNYDSPEVVVKDVSKIVEKIETEKYIIMGVIKGRSEEKGTSAYRNITLLNSELKEIYKDRYLDTQSVLTGDEIVPEKLRSDSEHLNDIGQKILAAAVAKKIVGSWDLGAAR
ncbi:hypothetical protein [Deinococcus aquaticus]|uniref:hypothetical protein n=1 Tax=Deinococcus aquaticus TaxID=328692 RepID=UPI003F44D8F1